VALRPTPELGSDRIRPVVFSDLAHKHRDEIDDLATVMKSMPDTSARMKASFGKWPGLFARLCLTFHIIAAADARRRGETSDHLRVIQEHTAAQVSAYMRDILLPHMIRAEAIMFSTDQSGHARWIAGFILAHGLDRIQTRDIVRSYEALKSPEAKREMQSVMESLVAIGWLDPVEPTNFSKPTTTWMVNPAVHTIFAERAKAEATRRREGKAKIIERINRERNRKSDVGGDA
jgi:hypothetical protein